MDMENDIKLSESGERELNEIKETIADSILKEAESLKSKSLKLKKDGDIDEEIIRMAYVTYCEDILSKQREPRKSLIMTLFATLYGGVGLILSLYSYFSPEIVNDTRLIIGSVGIIFLISGLCSIFYLEIIRFRKMQGRKYIFKLSEKENNQKLLEAV